MVPWPPPPVIDSMGFRVDLTSGDVVTILTYAPDNDCSHGGDWYYSAQDEATLVPTEFELCADACERVSVDPTATIDVVFDCLGEV
jgi:hypothetical protein